VAWGICWVTDKIIFFTVGCLRTGIGLLLFGASYLSDNQILLGIALLLSGLAVSTGPRLFVRFARIETVEKIRRLLAQRTAPKGPLGRKKVVKLPPVPAAKGWKQRHQHPGAFGYPVELSGAR